MDIGRLLAMTPDELSYTAEHEWVRMTESGNVRFGITHFAQESLGDIVYVSLPSIGENISAGSTCGEVESTKSVSDIYAPVDGEVVAINSNLDPNPEIINSDPYNGGWMVEVELSDPSQIDGLLSAAEYLALTEQA
jgi:glycine cleavage system H protein